VHDRVGSIASMSSYELGCERGGKALSLVGFRLYSNLTLDDLHLPQYHGSMRLSERHSKFPLLHLTLYIRIACAE
jgi:hypothetical protein